MLVRCVILSALLAGCTVKGSLGGFAGTPSFGFAPASGDADEALAEAVSCRQELGRDTGGTADRAAPLDERGVRGCLPANDETDGFLVDTDDGGSYVVILRSKDDVALHLSVYEVDGERLLFKALEGHEGTKQRFEVPEGSQVFVKIQAFSSSKAGRYELRVKPEADIAYRSDED